LSRFPFSAGDACSEFIQDEYIGLLFCHSFSNALYESKNDFSSFLGNGFFKGGTREMFLASGLRRLIC